MEPFLLEVIRAGMTLLRNMHEDPPGNILSGPEFSAIDTNSLNGTRMSYPIRCLKVSSLTAKMMIAITASPLAAVQTITVILPSL